MTDSYFNVPDDDPGEGDRTVRAELRRQAREGEKARKEAAALRRELAFTKAGVPTDTKLARLFASTYEGAIQADAVRAAWEELVPPAPAPAPVDPDDVPLAAQVDDVTDPGERASTAERNALASAGAGHDVAQWTPDPRSTGRAAFEKVMAEGGTREDGMAEHFSHLVAGAMANDPRVTISSGTGEHRGRRR